MHADAAARKVVEFIERVLARRLSAQDKQLLLRRSFQLKILHFSRVAHKSDVLNAIQKVEGSIVDGILQIMKCSDAQVNIAQITLLVRQGGWECISCLTVTAPPVVLRCCLLLSSDGLQ
jgi:hypothetical protein